MDSRALSELFVFVASYLIIYLGVGTEAGSSMLHLVDVTLVVIIVIIFVTLSSDTRMGHSVRIAIFISYMNK